MKPITPKVGQESVWEYPRPPRVEETKQRIRVVFEGVTLVDTTRAKRLLETSHPPTYYLPPEDVALKYLHQSELQSFCEWKGMANYYHLQVGAARVQNVAWYYPTPTAGYALLAGHLAFYPQKMSACFVDEELVTPQPGRFYGGWITSHVVGPFKGEPGTEGW
jgi:uncharacterized protein (DUF427 family)